MENAKLSRIPRMLLGTCLMALALPARAQAPQDFKGWEAGLKQAYGHAGKVKVWKHEPSGHPACMQNEKWSQTYEASFLPGGVRASIQPEDRQRFALVFLSIRPLKPGADLPALLRQVAAAQGAPPHCFSSKEAQLQLAWAGHWITLSCGCAAGDLVYYEAGDLLDWLEGLQPGSLPEQVFFSLCGRMELRQVETTWLREEARKKRSFWGREFPAARRGAAERTLVGVAKNAKAGAVLLVEGQGPIYLEGLAAWPEQLLDRRVEARGRPVEEKLIPDPGPDEHGAYTQGAEGTQTVLKAPTYRLAP
jgi:hypothetical protein